MKLVKVSKTIRLSLEADQLLRNLYALSGKKYSALVEEAIILLAKTMEK